LGMTGHHARLRVGEIFGGHQRQTIQPHIMHRSRCGTDVARTLRTYQDDGDLYYVWLGTHGRLWAHCLCSLSRVTIPLGAHCSMDASRSHRTLAPAASRDNFDISAFFHYYDPPL